MAHQDVAFAQDVLIEACGPSADEKRPEAVRFQPAEIQGVYRSWLPLGSPSQLPSQSSLKEQFAGHPDICLMIFDDI